MESVKRGASISICRRWASLLTYHERVRYGYICEIGNTVYGSVIYVTAIDVSTFPPNLVMSKGVLKRVLKKLCVPDEGL